MGIKNWSDTSIKTERLWLRQIDETDTEAIVSLRSEEAVYKYFLNPVKITVKDHERWYKEHYIISPDRIDWIAVDDKKGAFIGVYGVKRLDDRTVEVSYITNPVHKGWGYALESVSAIIDWCTKNWNIDTVMAEIHKDNVISIKFAHCLGFTKEKTYGDFCYFKKQI